MAVRLNRIGVGLTWGAYCFRFFTSSLSKTVPALLDPNKSVLQHSCIPDMNLLRTHMATPIVPPTLWKKEVTAIAWGSILREGMSDMRAIP
jgi:hypothetical protein